MKQIDVRFDEAAIQKLKSMIGKELLSYKITPSAFTTSVYGAVAMDFGDKAYEFSNFIEVADYFGNLDDVAFFKLKDCNYNEVCSFFLNKSVVTVPINKTVREIDIVNENQRLFENEIQTYDVWITRGIIFRFEDGSELSLEKDIWFSEDILVDQGFDLINQFESTDSFLEEWNGEEYRGECSRGIQTISFEFEAEGQSRKLVSLNHRTAI